MVESVEERIDAWKPVKEEAGDRASDKLEKKMDRRSRRNEDQKYERGKVR